MGTEATRRDNNRKTSFPKDAVTVDELTSGKSQITILATGETFEVKEDYVALTADMDVDILKREIRRLRTEAVALRDRIQILENPEP